MAIGTSVRAAMLPPLLLLMGLGVAPDQTSKYHADLMPNATIPPVENSPGSGRANFNIYQHTEAVRTGEEDHLTVMIWIADYSVSIYNITNVYSVECHQAPVGSNGDLVAYLYGPQANPTSDPPVNGVINAGTLHKENLKGPLRGKDIKDFKDHCDDGDMYVLATTTKHPNNELRGQVYPGG